MIYSPTGEATSVTTDRLSIFYPTNNFFVMLLVLTTVCS